MKKFFSFLSASVALALAFVSCQKNQETDFTPASRNIKFYASELVTKTAFGTPDPVGAYPVLWTSNQQVSISMNKASAVKADVAPDETGATAEFTPVKEFAADGSSTYTFYAISPSNAVISDISAKKDDNYYNRWSVQIPADQTPLENSADELAQILVAKYTEDKAGIMPESVTFNFSHITAYGKFSLVNLALDSDEAVAGVSLEAEEEWAGRWFYYVEDSEVDTDIKAGTWAENGTAGTNIISLKTNKTSDIWFACRPVDMGGKTIKLSVNTSKDRVFTKTITIPAGYKFQAGHIASFGVNMAGVTPEGAKTYVLIKDVSEIQEGEEIIIVAKDAGFAIGTTQNGNNRSASDVTIDTNTDGKSVIVNPSATVLRLNIAEGNKTGTFALETINGGASSGYLYAASSGSNYLRTETTLTDNSSWEIEIVGGIASVTAQGTNTRNTLRYNSGSNIFSCYAPTSTTGTLVRIFMLNGVGNEPVKAPVSIEISDASTNFEVGGTYAFDGKVTLTYNDGTTKELTDSEYTVDASAVDMTTAGIYTVTVTLKEDSSITATIDINVTTPAKTYVKATSITSGKQYLMVGVKAGKTYLATPIPSGKNWAYPAGYEVTDSVEDENTIKIGGAEDYLFEITASGEGYTIKQPDGRFVYADGSFNTLNAGTTEGVWTIVKQSDNSFKITSAGTYIQFGEGTYTTFGRYSSDQSGASLPFLYVLKDDSTPMPHGVTVEPTTITLAGASGSSAVVNATSNYEVTYEILSGSGFSVVQDGKNFTVTADAEGGSAEATLGTLRIKESADATAFADVTVKQSAKSSGTEIVDILTADLFAATTTTYTDFSGVSATNTNHSTAVYAGQSAKTSEGAIQMRSKNSNSGIVSTTSGGTIKSVKITVASGTNTIDVYGSNTAYTGATDLYNASKQGTKIGSLSASGTIDVTDDYQYIGIRSYNGAIYISQIEITYN